MGWWLSGTSNQTFDIPGNKSAVNVWIYLNWDSYSGYWGYPTTGYVNIAGTLKGFTGPSEVNRYNTAQSGSVLVGQDYTIFTHDANGNRGQVYTGGQLQNTLFGELFADIGMQPALNYDRKPDAPSSVTPTLNSDKSISVTSNAVSSPAGTATYYVGYSSDGGSTWSSDITIGGNARTYTFTPGSLTYGLTYKFRMKASNSDGTSAYTTTTTDTFLPAGGKRFDGSTWNATGTAKRFDGTNWVTLATAKRFNGTSWADLT